MRCAACGKDDPPLRERKDPTRLFCSTGCQRVWYNGTAAAAPIDRGIFWLWKERQKRTGIGIYQLFLSSVKELPLDDQVRALVFELKEYLASSNWAVDGDREREQTVLDSFFHPDHAADVLQIFGVSQDYIKRKVFQQALGGLHATLAMRVLHYRVNPYETGLPGQEHDPFGLLMDALEQRLQYGANGKPVAIEEQIALCAQASGMAKLLVDRGDFQHLDRQLRSLLVLHVQLNATCLLVTDLRNVDLVDRLVRRMDAQLVAEAKAAIPEQQPVWIRPPRRLLFAMYSDSLDMVRMLLNLGHNSTDALQQALFRLFRIPHRKPLDNADPDFVSAVLGELLKQKQYDDAFTAAVLLEALTGRQPPQVLSLIVTRVRPTSAHIQQALVAGYDATTIESVLLTPEMNPAEIQRALFGFIKFRADEGAKSRGGASPYVTRKEIADSLLVLRALAKRCPDRELLLMLLLDPNDDSQILYHLVAGDELRFDANIRSRADPLLMDVAFWSPVYQRSGNTGEQRPQRFLVWLLMQFMFQLVHAREGNTGSALYLMDRVLARAQHLPEAHPARALNPTLVLLYGFRTILKDGDLKEIALTLVTVMLEHYGFDTTAHWWAQWRDQGPVVLRPLLIAYEERRTKAAEDRRETGKGQKIVQKRIAVAINI
jgi:hypothetical protein